MKLVVNICIILWACTTLAQVKIEGKVIDKKNRPMVGANVFIEGSYDGGTTNEKGEFLFETNLKGTQTIIITQINYDDYKQTIEIEKYTPQSFILMTNINTIDTVIITAGTLKAGDNSKASALKPLDVVTTAGALGDVVGAFQTLPGAQINGENGRLLVRGGDADETQTYIDGIRVAQPYGVSANNMPTRSRFSPMLFKGMTFSTGGYSAEFGDALSSVLLMNTINEPELDETNFSFMTVGLGVGRTKKWKSNSLSFNTSYINLQPYQWIVPQRANWNKPYQSASGESVFRHQFSKGLFKLYAAFDYGTFNLNQDNINALTPDVINNNNNNLYVNSSYKGKLYPSLTLHTGASIGFNNVKINYNSIEIKSKETASHFKLKLDKKINNYVSVSIGGDYFITQFDETFTPNAIQSLTYGYKANTSTLFAESDILFSPEFALKVGTRFMHNDLLKKSVVEPRISLAYKVSKDSQFSMAYGNFHQAPKQDYLKFEQVLNFEKTQHYILNYMYMSNNRSLRAELYYKKYNDLVKYDTATPSYFSNYTNQGYGYAKGFDLMWSDSKSIKYFNYWLTYTYIDSKRDFRNYATSVMPSFMAHHTLTIVGKYWVNDWKSQISVTNTFTTGRPYNDPNTTQFMSGQTREYNNLSISWAYLLTQQKILYFSISNVLGRENVFGYNYASKPDVNGIFPRQAIEQPADRFFFVGFFWTISTDKKKNQLDTL